MESNKLLTEWHIKGVGLKSPTPRKTIVWLEYLLLAEVVGNIKTEQVVFQGIRVVGNFIRLDLGDSLVTF